MLLFPGLRSFRVLQKFGFAAVLAGLALFRPAAASERVAIHLASVPKPLPDGQRFVFSWCGDIWIASVYGGEAVPLTRHPAHDSWPCVSPDGREIAFASDRDNTTQVYVMPITGGPPEKITVNTEGAIPLAWFPDGKSILIRAVRDQAPDHAQRFFRVARHGNGREQLLFNAYGERADISPDGQRILFVRDGVDLYRKGYHGSLAAKIWLADLRTGRFERILAEPGGDRTPLWRPDGKGFYYVSQASGTFNLWEYDLAARTGRQRTFFKEDSVIFPGISRNGRTIIFRNLFDFYRFDPMRRAAPQRIVLYANTDIPRERVRRRWYNTIWNNQCSGSLDFTRDGMEMCFTTGGDLWVMDTVLREPRQVTSGSGVHETEAVFTPDDRAIILLRDFGDRVEVWRVERGDPGKFWWENRNFRLRPLIQDHLARTGLSVSPDGTRIAYRAGRGDLYVAGLDGRRPVRVATSIGSGGYDWSPDSRWLVCERSEDSGEKDVWIVSAAGDRPAYDLSRAPGPDYDPRWSPDGRKIAFIGRRYDGSVDVYYAFLREADERTSREDRTLQKAIETLRKARRPKRDKKKEKSPAPRATGAGHSTAAARKGKRPAASPESSPASRKSHPKSPAVPIDFAHLSERVHGLGLHNANPGRLVWKYDSKTLVFRAVIGGRRGAYRVEIPDKLHPIFMTEKTGVPVRWIKEGDKLLWMVDQLPAHYTKTFPFKAYQYTNIADYQRLAFRLVWRTMRDEFYDPTLNHRDWNAVRLKYEDMAAAAPDRETFQRTIAMLLGELNASHMGFSENDLSRHEWVSNWREKGWNIRTGHLGLFFDPAYPGPGLKVARVLAGGPCDRPASRVLPGEIVLAINEKPVSPGTNLARRLTGRFPRDDFLTVRNAKGRTRRVRVRTIGYGRVRSLLAKERDRRDRARVEKLSGGRLGYLRIARMRWPDYRKFEKDVYAEGSGKDGLIIDVRGNPGGFVADHLLDVLCHPKHAVTVPRGGGPSYPAGYLEAAFWTRPIVVLCDQYTASNGEIFCHAIQTLGRGKIVGTTTRGAVISTGSRNILDEGSLRVPGRGWFVAASGKNMELNGCAPDVPVQVRPGELPAGNDRQLDKAVEVLMAEVRAWKKRPRPPLHWK